MGPICNCVRSYPNRHPTNQFLPLAIEVFGYLHKHVDVFLHDYANAIWSLKGIEGPHLSTLIIFFRQKVLITLQMIQLSSILSWVITIGLTTSRLPPLQNTPLMIIIDLLQVVGYWHINMADLPHVVNYGHGELFWTNLMSCHFSLFLYLTFLYISLIYSVFLNKALQVFDELWLPLVNCHSLFFGVKF